LKNNKLETPLELLDPDNKAKAMERIDDYEERKEAKNERRQQYPDPKE